MEMDLSVHAYKSPITSWNGAYERRGVVAACVTSSAELEQLAEEWRELFQRIGCTNVFLSWEWMATWWRHWGAGHQLLVVTARNGAGRLIAVAPFYIRRSRLGTLGSRALRFLADTHVTSSYDDLLVEQEYQVWAIHALVGVVKHHRSEWDYIELRDANPECPRLNQMLKAFKSLGMTEFIQRTYVTTCAVLPGSFDAFLGSHSGKTRRWLRHVRHTLDQHGVQLVALQHRADIQEKFGELIRLHRLRFHHIGEHSAFLPATVQAFHTDLLMRMTGQGWARMFLLQGQDGVAIAALYGFSAGKTFVGYQTGWDPTWARLSPGRAMIFSAVEEAIREGHNKYDFKGEAPYKQQWVNGTMRARTVCLFDRRIRSQWARFLVWVIEQARHAKRSAQRSAGAQWAHAQAIRWSRHLRRLVRRWSQDSTVGT